MYSAEAANCFLQKHQMAIGLRAAGTGVAAATGSRPGMPSRTGSAVAAAGRIAAATEASHRIKAWLCRSFRTADFAYLLLHIN